MALAAGVAMKVVSENLGHSTIAVTANVYSQATTDLAIDSADAWRPHSVAPEARN